MNARKLIEAASIQPGVRVILKGVPVGDSDFPDGLPEERGVVISVDDDMLVVQVDDKYLDDDDDDGMREVSADQATVDQAPALVQNPKRVGAAKLLMAKVKQRPWDKRN